MMAKKMCAMLLILPVFIGMTPSASGEEAPLPPENSNRLVKKTIQMLWDAKKMRDSAGAEMEVDAIDGYMAKYLFLGKSKKCEITRKALYDDVQSLHCRYALSIDFENKKDVDVYIETISHDGGKSWKLFSFRVDIDHVLR